MASGCNEVYWHVLPLVDWITRSRVISDQSIQVPVPGLITNDHLSLSKHSQSMSQTHSTATSSSNFQLIFNNALEGYERRTKQDLLVHPLAAQFQACDSPSAILAILQQQIKEFNQSRRSDKRLTKWLDPTVNVLYTFSEALGEGVGLVCLST